jgi:hypothetical protein
MFRLVSAYSCLRLRLTSRTFAQTWTVSTRHALHRITTVVLNKTTTNGPDRSRPSTSGSSTPQPRHPYRIGVSTVTTLPQNPSLLCPPRPPLLYNLHLIRYQLGLQEAGRKGRPAAATAARTLAATPIGTAGKPYCPSSSRVPGRHSCRVLGAGCF